MVEPTLHEMLSELRQHHTTRLQEIDQERERHCTRQAEIQNAILRLREELEDLRTACRELEAERADEKRLHYREEADFVLQGLEASYTTLLETQAYWLARVRLMREREALLAQDPELSDILRDYEAFEQKPTDVLESVPESYRATLVAEHEKRASRVAPYLKLLQEEDDLRCREPVVLQVVMSPGIDGDIIGWVFPFRGDDRLSSEAYDALCEVIWVIQQNVTSLGIEPDWFLDDVSVDTWAGFDALLVEGDYAGGGSPLDSARCFLGEAGSAHLFSGSGAMILLTEMSGGAWQIHARRPEPRAAVPEPSLARVPEPQPDLIGLTDGWYTTDDVASWQRPLRVVSDSLWNVQARRLRTLLVRMVGKGRIGAESVEASRLWEDLPSPHGENLRTGVERLLEEGLIVRSDSEPDDGHLVSLSPDRLEDVQDLINREVTQFWAGIVGSEFPAE
jgi:hypothetical protein